jgi:hypothetical protein
MAPTQNRLELLLFNGPLHIADHIILMSCMIFVHLLFSRTQWRKPNCWLKRQRMLMKLKLQSWYCYYNLYFGPVALAAKIGHNRSSHNHLTLMNRCCLTQNCWHDLFSVQIGPLDILHFYLESILRLILTFEDISSNTDLSLLYQTLLSCNNSAGLIYIIINSHKLQLGKRLCSTLILCLQIVIVQCLSDNVWPVIGLLLWSYNCMQQQIDTHVYIVVLDHDY